MGRHHGYGDVLLLTTDILEDTKRFGGLYSHLDGTQVDPEGSTDGTVLWVVDVPDEVDLLAVFLVFLLPPLKADVVDVLN